MKEQMSEVQRVIRETYGSFREELDKIKSDRASLEVQTIADLEDNLARYKTTRDRLSRTICSASFVSRTEMRYVRKCENCYEHLTKTLGDRIDQIRERYAYLFRFYTPN